MHYPETNTAFPFRQKSNSNKLTGKVSQVCLEVLERVSLYRMRIRLQTNFEIFIARKKCQYGHLLA